MICPHVDVEVARKANSPHYCGQSRRPRVPYPWRHRQMQSLRHAGVEVYLAAIHQVRNAAKASQGAVVPADIQANDMPRIDLGFDIGFVFERHIGADPFRPTDCRSI